MVNIRVKLYQLQKLRRSRFGYNVPLCIVSQIMWIIEAKSVVKRIKMQQYAICIVHHLSYIKK